MMRQKRQAANGFTLIELLVAMLIFAVLGGLAYQGLFQVQRVREAVSSQSEQLGKMQRAFFWLADDMAQVADRPIRSTLGSQVGALIISEAGESFIEFTRAGWTNPAGDILPPRSNLQRVAYALDGDRLIRKYWYHLDQAGDEEPRRRLLIDGVNDVQMRFLDASSEWHDSWPPSNSDPEAQRIALPAAIEFVLDLERVGKITRLFGLPG